MGLIYGNLNAQGYRFLGSKVYGGDSGELCNHLLKVSEDKLLMIGESNSNVSGNKTVPNCNSNGLDRDLWLVMVNTNFNVLWQMTLGGTNQEKYGTAINAGNGQVLVACMSASDSSCTRSTQLKGGGDIIIYMIDSTGTVIWENNFGTVDDCFGIKLKLLSDGNFIMLTSSNAGIGFDKTSASYGGDDIWLVKFESNGNIIFDKTYGGDQVERPATIDNQTNLDIIEANNNEFVIFTNTTSSNSIDVSDTSHGFNDFWMFTIDSLGNKITDYCFGGTFQDLFTSAVITSNGYLIAGGISSPQGGSISQPPLLPWSWNGWIISVDSTGIKKWDRRYQSGATVGTGSEAVEILNIVPASNNEFWVTGTCNTIAGKDVSEPPFGSRDAWVFKIDSTGAILWDKRFGSSSQTFTSNSVLMADSSIFLFCAADTGITNVKAEHGYGRTDYYLVHFSYANTTPLSEIEFKQSQIQLYPNPTQDIVNVNYLDWALPDKLEMYDVHGKLLRSINAHNNSIDVSYLSPSIYIIKFVYTEGAIFKKFVKQ
jgi:hypothetical protein